MTLASFYVPREGWYRRLSPPTKLVLPLALMTVAFLVNAFLLNAILVAIALGLLRVAAVSRSVTRVFASVLVTLIPVITVSWTIFYRSGATIAALGPVAITVGGLGHAVVTDLRFTSIVLFVPLVLATMSQQDLVAALRWFRIPYVLCFIIALSLRTIPMLERDVTLIRDAQRSRGIDLDRGGLLVRVRLLWTVVVPLMTVSIARLDVLSRVIESRGIARRGPRSFYRRPNPTVIDWLLMVGSVLVIVGIFGAKMTPAGAALLG